jgi:uroporphyrinogen decarboxylase
VKNDLFIRAAKGLETERVPVWLMRQAGRILPEYRAIRSSLSGFKELVTTPALAAEVTIQPVDILGVDAAIIFSDILVIPEAMGLPYQMVEKVGPAFENTIKTEADFKKLRTADVDTDLNYVFEAIKICKKELDGRVPLIGFAGAPFTIFTYMVEGGGSKTFSKARRMLYQNPELAHKLLQKITDNTILYLKGQIKAGADLVQLFDSWAGLLSTEQYAVFSLPYLKQVCDALSKEHDTPITVFAKGAYSSRAAIATLNCQVVGLDWNMPIAETRKIIGNDKTLQGNLDPCALYGSFDEIRKETKKMIDQFGTQRFIANLGHGVYPDTPPENVKCFIDAVKNYSN